MNSNETPRTGGVIIQVIKHDYYCAAKPVFKANRSSAFRDTLDGLFNGAIE